MAHQDTITVTRPLPNTIPLQHFRHTYDLKEFWIELSREKVVINLEKIKLDPCLFLYIAPSIFICGHITSWLDVHFGTAISTGFLAKKIVGNFKKQHCTIALPLTFAIRIRGWAIGRFYYGVTRIFQPMLKTGLINTMHTACTSRRHSVIAAFSTLFFSPLTFLIYSGLGLRCIAVRDRLD